MTPVPIAAVTNLVTDDRPHEDTDYPTIPMPAIVTKKGDVIERAIQMLKDNPYWQKRTLRDLENETGIDRNTWAKAKKRAK